MEFRKVSECLITLNIYQMTGSFSSLLKHENERKDVIQRQKFKQKAYKGQRTLGKRLGRRKLENSSWFKTFTKMSNLKTWFTNFNVHEKHVGTLFKVQIPRFYLQNFCTLNKNLHSSAGELQEYSQRKNFLKYFLCALNITCGSPHRAKVVFVSDMILNEI